MAILRELQEDAGRTNVELAAAVGLSPPATLRRVRALRAGGAVRAIRADVDPRALGWPLRAMVIATLDRHEEATDERFARAVSSLSRVVAADWVTGEQDAILQVVARDVDELHQLLIALGKAGAVRVVTHLRVKTLKSPSPLPRLP